MGGSQSSSGVANPEQLREMKNKAGKWKLDVPITGFKKIECKCRDGKLKRFVAELEVPAGATVVHPYENVNDGYGHTTVRSTPSGKFRTDKFILKEILTNPGDSKPVSCHSIWTSSFTYSEGETYKPNSFNKNVDDECTNGLYFFLDKQRAVDYGVF